MGGGEAARARLIRREGNVDGQRGRDLGGGLTPETRAWMEEMWRQES